MIRLSQKSLKKNSWLTETVDGLVINRSPLLAGYAELVHAFTTRHKGDTPPPADSFNLGRHRDTDESRADAAKNRLRLCEALRLNFGSLSVPAQVHSSIVLVANESQSYPDVDGLITNAVDKPLLLHFADCVPVMIYDPKKRVLCVVHAGWKGTAGSIALQGVRLMIQTFGCFSGDMVAAVGPAIGSCCYPTGEEVAEKLAATISTTAGLISRKAGIPYPDLKAINTLQLLEAGVGQVDTCELCTACNPEMFYSHRQSGGDTGRQGAIASIVNPAVS